ncbi:phenylacetate--CoA ligase family protein [Desulfovermiculus halophilus]|uniref:phenylacetate--CoA ligase family protein n=1 Tax=Desulfovermiculus halophilus TaxID=339722 RepID=UPI000482FA50|nr:phenylacetate--CoA ligase [Desulfovermiculus halophilus]
MNKNAHTHYRFFSDYTQEGLAEQQLRGLQWTLKHAYAGSPYYRRRLDAAGVDPRAVRSLDHLTHLPFTTVDDLRSDYPLPLLSVPEEDVVRIHASSGTTGKRKILAYTQDDIDTWKLMMARCFELAGLERSDRVQIAVGYGLWTAGVGFQLGCEHFGSMALPLGPGNLEIQLQFLTDLQSTCLCSTASMALLLAEEVEKYGLQDRVRLKTAIFGAEPHTAKMRQRVEEVFGLEDCFDIPGLTELYGPGAGLECREHQGLHYWADLYILEIIDPQTLQPVAPGEVGEMVVTTLCKQGVPLIRYRTRDLTRLVPGECPCGLGLPRHDRILGRSDDMFIFRGVNIYPGQIADVLHDFAELSSEYQVVLDRKEGVDHMLLKVERHVDARSDLDSGLSRAIAASLRKHLLVRSEVSIVDPGLLPRTFAKSKRVLDQRNGEES